MLANLIIWYAVFVLSTTFHEYAHAWVGNRGGDLTASQNGLFTLHPLPHIRRSPFGMLIVPLVTFYLQGGMWMIGWASVPFNPMWARRYPRRQAAMSIAGPLANFSLALVALILIKVLIVAGVLVPSHLGASWPQVALPASGAESGVLGALSMALSVTLVLNLILGVFNLIPLPPLDGAGVCEGLWPKSLGKVYEKMAALPVFQLVGLVLAWKLAPVIITPVLGMVAALVMK